MLVTSHCLHSRGNHQRNLLTGDWTQAKWFDYNGVLSGGQGYLYKVVSRLQMRDQNINCSLPTVLNLHLKAAMIVASETYKLYVWK
jgi:hypothetical protein